MTGIDRQSRKRAETRGRLAERLAGIWLSLKGYHILEHRWKTKSGEVDLIARKGPLLVFVEVKARKTASDGVEAVSWTARRRIEKAAIQYISSRRYSSATSYRFDIVTVSGLRLSHRRNAWLDGD